FRLAASTQANSLAPGSTDHYAFTLRPSEIHSTGSGTVILGVSVEPAVNSQFLPAVPTIPGLTPLFQASSPREAFGLFAVDRAGLDRIDVSGATTTTSGWYLVRLFVADDLNFDGNVDGLDAQLLAGAMGTHAGEGGFLPFADLNRDSVIDQGDIPTL